MAARRNVNGDGNEIKTLSSVAKRMAYQQRRGDNSGIMATAASRINAWRMAAATA